MNSAICLHESSKDTPNMWVFKVLIKIFEFCHIIQIVAPWKEDGVISSHRCQISNIPRQSKFGSNWLVFLEVINVLTVEHIHIINIFLLAHEFAVVDQRVGLLINFPSVFIG